MPGGRLCADLTTTAPVPDDALALADLEDALTDWLSERNVEQDWIIGPTLPAAGADLEGCNRAESLFGGSALDPALEWVAATLSMEKLLSEVRESTRRVSELVAAVKSYSQMDTGSGQDTDVVEGLESTLVMLGHKLRGGVEIVREYSDDLPSIDAYPGELNQVWTTLIDNAVDAMDEVGTLRVATLSDGAGVTVAKRAFEAFYTTKDVGKGTGLRLDIARRIVVERHGGTIDLESVPGRTVFRVCLPRVQAWPSTLPTRPLGVPRAKSATRKRLWCPTGIHGPGLVGWPERPGSRGRWSTPGCRGSTCPVSRFLPSYGAPALEHRQ